MGGKGKGKGPPPPPSGEAALKQKQELEEKRKAFVEEQKRLTEEKIQRCKEIEAQKRDLEGRVPTLKALDIHDVKWEEAKISCHLVGGKGTVGLAMFAGSSGGIDIVEFDSGAVCVRRTETLCPEIIADGLAQALGIRVARMRLVHPSSPEWQAIQDVFDRFDTMDAKAECEKIIKQLEQTDPEACTKLKEFMSQKRSVAVVEFVPGLSFDKAHDALTAPQDVFLKDLGKLCAYDVLMNNLDRFPLPCWANKGNLTNAMVTAAGELVGIDQQVNTIEDAAGLDKYLSHVRSLTSQLSRPASEASEDAMSCASAAKSIQLAVNENCGVALSDACIELVLEGLRIGLGAVEHKSSDINCALDAAAKNASELAMGSSNLNAAEQASNSATFVRRVVQEVAGALDG